MGRPKVPRERVFCFVCRAPFEKYPRLVRARNCCSRACQRAMSSEDAAARVGENHPNWRGGRDTYRGASWKVQRALALVRDEQKCQSCGKEAVTVHHKKPFRLFQDYAEANALTNLVTLCRRCHGEAEKVFWRAYLGETSVPTRAIFSVTCKRCGVRFDGREGAPSATGLLRFCRACRAIQTCQGCGEPYDLTLRQYSPERAARSRFCSRRCCDKAKQGLPLPYRRDKETRS